VESKIEKGKYVKVISNGVRFPEIHLSVSSGELREKVFKHLDENTYTLLILAADASDERKGFKESVQVLNNLYTLGITFQVLVIGGVSSEALKEIPPVKIYIAGFIRDSEVKLELIEMCDALLFTSHADNQPLTVLEALSCGLEVFAFSIGGLSEMPSKFSSLKLVLENNLEEMTKQISKASKGQRTNAEKFLAKKEAFQHLSENIFLENHLSHYRNLIGKNVKA
jgi:glycosyltransferase involved in cell wall biosynthesis